MKRFSILAVFYLAFAVEGRGAEVSYNRDIRPILSDNCFFCHGPDQNERKAKLRLDVREDALASEAFVPGKPEESELLKRVLTADVDDLMPPPESHKKLSEREKELLRQWIAEGAEYEGHWAYTPPVRAETPGNGRAIDYLVEARLKEVGLKKSAEADKRTLMRRLHFDLAGLPPKPQEVEEFAKDESPEAYSRLVERLLSAPEYGERMAIGWLDVVRFADTIGYHSDNPRNIWPYRDYVIKAFNENKPFDEFTREQLAGDLLPEPTLETRVASAFNRLLLTTEEGGAQAKDYEARMLTDRVRAVGTVWLGQTIGCAQCHDHKFDPITARDFYTMGAFFADIKEPIIGKREPGMMVPTAEEEAELGRLSAALDGLKGTFDGPHPDAAEAFKEWQQDQMLAAAREALWTPLRVEKAQSKEGARLEIQADHSILVKGKKPDTDNYLLTFARVPNGVRALRIEGLPDESLPSKGPGRAGNGNFVLSEVRAQWVKGESSRPVSFGGAAASYEQTFAGDNHVEGKWTAKSTIATDVESGKQRGWAILPESGKPHQLVLRFAEPLDPQPGEVLQIELRQQHGHGSHTLGKFRISATSSQHAAEAKPVAPLGAELVELLATPARDEAQGERLFAIFKNTAPHFQELRDQIASATKAKADFEEKIARCIVSVSDKPRTVRILPRGNWMIDTGEIVEPAFPEYLVEKKADGRRLNRLDLANWLVSGENPLTARVVMNRLWKQFFGTGLSKVVDDLGAQGEPPPNQALLDWLAVEFMESGWDMKHMVRLIVNSHTYKQTSVPSAEARERDPYNRELASQSRWRLDAELVRDNTLSVAGLLVKKIGGPSVKPYQPEGYWENLNFPVRTWEASTGQEQYRRGLYTWWQRSYLHPSMLAFDAPTREECAAERNRSNIPQQALVLLNDPTYVEASRAFATRILIEGGEDVSARTDWAWKQALNRAPSSEEARTIQMLVEKQLGEYRGNIDAANALLKVGQNPVPSNLDPAELAAWTNAARAILNLHEMITRS